ncbi:MAG: hypothetical protein V7L11_02230 [Nostoc sp.]|uniref:hypothetical protein n=1 Tax=Nostoc sp. TaxID=1180 RepID=UPI002FF89D4E
MQSTLFTELTVSEEANLSGGTIKVTNVTISPIKVTTVTLGIAGAGGGAGGGGQIGGISGGVAGGNGNVYQGS